jgi:hypothetical protein
MVCVQRSIKVDWTPLSRKRKTTNPNLRLEFLHKDEFENNTGQSGIPDIPISHNTRCMRDEVQDYNVTVLAQI